MIAWAAFLTFILVLLKGFSTKIQKSESTSEPKTHQSCAWFEWTYLTVYVLVMGSDWLQGPYVYELYHQYGYKQAEIAQFFLCGFGSSMIAGTIIGSLADKYGRKASCQIFAILYFLSCLLKHYPSPYTLVMSRLLSGISTSILFSSFESWLITEHHSRGFPPDALKGIFSKATTANGMVAICSGIVANLAYDHWGPIGPFDISACLLVISLMVITFNWNENYGDQKAQVRSSFQEAFQHICRSRPTQILGAVQSLFESSMYIFVFMWTPTLKSSTTASSIEHGWIFACFMISTMIGSSIFRCLTQSKYALESWAPFIFLFAAVSLLLPSFFQHFATRLIAFFVFEVCCGIFWPTMGTLRAQYIPDSVRSTTMNLFRVPLNCIVVTLLVVMERLTANTVWVICATMLLTACGLQYALKTIAEQPTAAETSKQHSE